MSASAMAGITITGLLLVIASALTLAARALNRVQRRDWAGSESLDETGAEDARVSVETAFNTLLLTRQFLLILLVAQIVSLSASQWGRAGLGAGIGISLLAYLLLDNLVPDALVATLGARRVLFLGAPMLHPARWLLGPLARYLSLTTDRARGRVRDQAGSEDRGDLGAFLDLVEEEGMVTESEEALLRGVADFEGAVVREVMTPRVDIVSIDVGASLRDLRQLIARHRYSRIPVVAGDMDHVVGFANLRDLVAALEQSAEGTSISDISRPVRFVPETKRVNELLQEFQQRQEQLAMVVDEYGGTAGLVTLEDLVEEIVGEIQDEDEPPRQLLEMHGDSVMASGKVEIEDVEAALGVTFPVGDFHTVGGLVFTHLGRVPKPGEEIELGGLFLEVLEADDRRIHRVRLTSR